jgi:hypothetical protein
VVFDSDAELEAMVFYNGESAGQFVSTTGIHPTILAQNIGTSNLNFNVFAHILNTSTIDPYTNGTLQTSASNQGNSLKGLSLGNVRANIDPSYSFNGVIAEVIIMAGALGSGSRIVAERNTGAYFGISVA